MRKTLLALGSAALGAAAVGWMLTAPVPLSAVELSTLQAHTDDPDNGRTLFWTGGCASCHAAARAEGDARLVLEGGQGLPSPYGTFAVPNISMDQQDGIGAWSRQDFVTAMLKGTAPDGRHYYPAFPYASYAKMTVSDAADLWAFMQTLPAAKSPADAVAADIRFPFNIRRGIGLWKRAFVSSAPVVSDAALNDDIELLRGRYLVEGPGHCGECHTPRNLAGAMQTDLWMAGAPNPEGEGRIPNITPHRDGLESWSADDIAYALETGFTPDFDSLGGTMASVVRNMAELSAQDRAAMAAYLKAIAPVADQ